MTTRWAQCPDCKGLGKTRKGKTCKRCKGKLYIPVTIQVTND